MSDKAFKKLWRNVNMSSVHGASGARTDTNPKLSGRIRKGNQSTRRHKISKQNGECYWLNIKMSLDDLFISRSPFAPSVDRLNSSVGYHKDNIVLCSRFANLGRGAYDKDDFQPRLIKLLKEANSKEV